MEINFGERASNCSIIFDVNGNYTINNGDMKIISLNNWNGRVVFPNGITHACVNSYDKSGQYGTIDNRSTSFNSSITLPPSVTNCDYLVHFREHFNQNINIPDSVTRMERAFYDCQSFNQNVQIPSRVTGVYQMFTFCIVLNQNILIPDNVTGLRQVFQNCWNLNQNIKMPNRLTGAYMAFENCIKLNQNIKLPSQLGNAEAMFRGCTALNQNILIPNTVNYMSNIFNRCEYLSNITIAPKNREPKFTNSIIRSSNSRSINIWTDETTAINIMNAGFIQGNIKPTMTAIDNGYYNATYNVYIYTNTVFPD